MKETFDHNVFFEFEKKYRLFELKHDTIFIWDIVRNDIYLELLWGYISRTPQKASKSTIRQRFFLVIEFFRFLIYIFVKPCDILFFSASRNKTNTAGKFHDQNLADIYKVVEGQKLCFESFQTFKDARQYSPSAFNFVGYIRKLLRPFYNKRINSASLVDTIKCQFPNFNLSTERVNQMIGDFLIDYQFYSFLFKLKRPKAIYVTQNGIQKGLFKAARDSKIPVGEVQHGIIDEGHLVYNYSKDIEYDLAAVYLPTHFFSFSEFWTDRLHFPFVTILPLGNNSFYTAGGQDIDNIRSSHGHGLLVASSDIFGMDLCELILEFTKLNNQVPVYFKLHPNQFQEADLYKGKFFNHSNVTVFTSEYSIYELISLVEAVLVIQSTAIYEALHMGRKGIIYKRNSYFRHNHIFDIPNVYLVDKPEDIQMALSADFIKLKNDNTFFSPFDNEYFLSAKLECQ